MHLSPALCGQFYAFNLNCWQLVRESRLQTTALFKASPFATTVDLKGDFTQADPGTARTFLPGNLVLVQVF